MSLQNTIISFLVAMGVLIYLLVFIDAAFGIFDLTNDAVEQFAMTIGASVSAFIGALLGLETKRYKESLRTSSNSGQLPAEARNQKSKQNKNKQTLQQVIIVVYLVTLVVGTCIYIFEKGSTNDTFIHSIFTNATGLMLGALAVVLSPIELGEN